MSWQVYEQIGKKIGRVAVLPLRLQTVRGGTTQGKRQGPVTVISLLNSHGDKNRLTSVVFNTTLN